jgi:GAF domain-containing protein
MSALHHPATRAEDADRLHGLLEAHRRITDELSLPAVLNSIVRVACDLVGATYGALGVLAPDGSLEHFVHTGIDEPTARLIGALPRGRGLLGAVLDHPGPVRLDDLGGDGRSGGFPNHHPPMTSFLGVPIRVKGEAFGELYLADPAPERFDVEDERLAVALAATAGTAIENARLYEETRRSRDWLNASGEIARTLLGNGDNEVLPELVSRAFRVADADYACLVLPAADAQLRVTAAMGIGAEQFRDLVFDPTRSVLGRAIVAAESVRTPDMTQWANPDFDNRHDFGPAMIVPLIAKDDRGAVLMMRVAGQPPFTAQDVEHASTFAAQVALAMELNGARAEAEQVRVLEDRNRIAQDLHDNVIQRLFATGVGLQALLAQLPDPELAHRLRRHIADLDETIDQIRSGRRSSGSGTVWTRPSARKPVFQVPPRSVM